MKMARIEDVSEFVLDGTHGSPVRVEVGVPVLSAQNVKHGVLSYETDRFTTEEEFRAFSSRMPFKAGDVLLTIVGTIGRSAVLTEVRPLVFQRSVAIIRPKSSVLNSRFFFHATQVQDFQTQLARSSNTSSQAGVYLGKIKEVTIPLPPLAEQRRIAEVLDRAEALRAKRRAALAQLDSLTQSLFVDLFGDPAKNPKGWAHKKIWELGKVSTGSTPPSAEPNMFDGPIPFVTPGDLESDEPIKRSLSLAGAERSRTVRSGATLVCCIGATIGKMGVASELSAFNQQINAVEWAHEVDDVYGFAVFRFFKPTIKAWGASTTLPILKKSSFERIEIPVPPLPLQREFTRRFEAVEKLKVSQRTALRSLDELFSALQYRAFKGEL